MNSSRNTGCHPEPKETIMKRIHKILAGAAGTLALVTTVAIAQGGPGYGMGPGMMHGGMGMGPGMMHGGPGMGMCSGKMQGGMGPGMMQGGGPGAMSAQHLTGMKTRLAITAEQEPAWQAFAAKAAEQATLMQAMHAQHQQAADANEAAPDRMARHIGFMTQRLAGMQAMNAAMKDLYGVLTPEQRTVADQSFGHMGPRGARHGMHG